VTTPSLPLLTQPCQNQEFSLNIRNLQFKKKNTTHQLNDILGHITWVPLAKNFRQEISMVSFSHH